MRRPGGGSIVVVKQAKTRYNCAGKRVPATFYSLGAREVHGESAYFDALIAMISGQVNTALTEGAAREIINILINFWVDNN
jgi:hypothetical protein